MPKDFKEFAVDELAHARSIIDRLDNGEWGEGSPELRRHYMGVIRELERLLGRRSYRDA